MRLQKYIEIPYMNVLYKQILFYNKKLLTFSFNETLSIYTRIVFAFDIFYSRYDNGIYSYFICYKKIPNYPAMKKCLVFQNISKASIYKKKNQKFPYCLLN